MSDDSVGIVQVLVAIDQDLDRLRAVAWATDTDDWKEGEAVLAARLELLRVLGERGFTATMEEVAVAGLELAEPLAQYVASAIALARQLGYDDRLAMFEALESGSLDLDVVCRQDAAVRVMYDRTHVAALAVLKHLGERELAVDYLTHLYGAVLAIMRLQWPWLVAALVIGFFERIGRWVLAIEPGPDFELMPASAGAAGGPLTAVIIPELGESREQVERRMVAEFRRLWAERVPERRGPGRPRSPAVLGRQVEWFFASRVSRCSIREIAGEAFPGSDRRSEVRAGIREAQRLLERSPYRYRDA